MTLSDRQRGAPAHNLDQPALDAEAALLAEARRQQMLYEPNATRPEPAAPPLDPAARTSALPLSFVQQRLWFLDQFVPGAANTLSALLCLTGSLHVAALAHSLDTIVRRHEVLRTTFPMIDGQPVQVIAPARALREAPVSHVVLDLQTLPQAEHDDHIRLLATAEAQRPFNLATGPLLRTTLLRLGKAEHVLLLTIHRIIADDWSIDVFIRELGALYAGQAHGSPAALPELPLQYADYAVWQRTWFQGEGGHEASPLQEQLAYWRSQLADLTVLNLPTDYPRPTIQRYRGATHTFALAAELRGRLTALGQRGDATLFMTLLAAFQALLSRYSGQTDIVVGTPIANRTPAAIEGLIGPIANTLVLRADLAGDPSFLALLRRVRVVCLQAYAHQDMPFERLVQEIHPARDLSRTPLFQVLFVLQNAALPTLEAPDLTLRPMDAAPGTAAFDLTLSLRETEQELLGTCEYSTDLFRASTIARMLEHLQTLLEGIVADADLRLAELPLMKEAERRQVLVDWNATQMAYPQDTCVHVLFEHQVELRADAVAVVFDGPTTDDRGLGTGDWGLGTGDQETTQSPIPNPQSRSILHPPSSILHPQHLTYRELNTRANQLARYLQGLGVGPEIRVGLCLERSLDLIIGMLGSLKAGGAFVLLDPAAPPERRSFMLADSQAPVLLTRKTISHFQSPMSQKTISRLRSPGPDNLAYVIYTSGSTGRPKGVLVSHEGLSNLVHWHQQAFGVTARDRATQMAWPAFDATVWEVWPYLAAGASIHIPPDAARAEPAHLRAWLVDHAITICFLPTPLAEQALLLAWPSGGALRTLLTGGDQLHHAPSAALPFVLVNNYGPTESTVVTTSGPVSPTDYAAAAPSIGRPIANTQVYVLDSHLRPTPVGVPGELYVGGAGLARGYLNRPDLTAERFVPNPFAEEVTGDRLQVTGYYCLGPVPCPLSPVPSLRLYKTGDLVRYLPDGALVFLGRLDQQVKVRGYRIELGEIATVLDQHPAVQQTVVVAVADGSGGMRLVAYIVPKIEDRGLKIEDSAPDAPEMLSSILYPLSSIQGELRGFLKEKLPDYMIPAAFVVLDALPLTPNGKVDRRALPLPEDMPASPEHMYIAPRTPIETVLVGMWSDALQIAQVSIDANFFDLGGHSLNATRIVSRIRQAFQIDLTVRHLFETPTVASLADRMVATEAQPGRTDKIARAFQRLQRISAEDRQKLLQRKKGSEGL